MYKKYIKIILPILFLLGKYTPAKTHNNLEQNPSIQSKNQPAKNKIAVYILFTTIITTGGGYILFTQTRQNPSNHQQLNKNITKQINQDQQSNLTIIKTHTTSHELKNQPTLNQNTPPLHSQKHTLKNTPPSQGITNQLENEIPSQNFEQQLNNPIEKNNQLKTPVEKQHNNKLVQENTQLQQHINTLKNQHNTSIKKNKNSQTNSKAHSSTQQNNLNESIILIDSPTSENDLSNSIVMINNPDQIESNKNKDTCNSLYNWLNTPLPLTSKNNTQQIIQQIIQGCLFYSTKTQQTFSEGTFCLLDQEKNLTNYLYNNKHITQRPSSHLKHMTTKKHKGIDLKVPITVGATKKRTILIIAYTINGNNMLLIKPENAPVVSFQHTLEYLLPPTSTNLPDRKERRIPLDQLPNAGKIKENTDFKEEDYKLYGISYLHNNNYFSYEKSIKKYLQQNKLDHTEIRIGQEVIITPEDLKKAYSTKKTYLKPNHA